VDQRQARGQAGRFVPEDVLGQVSYLLCTPRNRGRVLPRRWVVERAFAWLGRNRRLSKDYEELPCTEEPWISLAMIRLTLARLTR
jgi:transposase